MPLALPPDEVHLWYCLPDEIADARLLAAYDALLTPEERARRDRYRFDKSRREYLFTRALVRATLSRYAPVAPVAWRFQQNAYGRPEIDLAAHGPALAHLALPARDGHAALRFNLSNTYGLIACAVVLDRDLGVDVEDTERPGETVSIADGFFSRLEIAALRALPPARQPSRFFDYWTLKEAYIKARGLGLAIPLDQFSFLLDDGPPIRVAFDPALGDDASTWQFEQFPLTQRHRTSAAVRRGDGPDLRFVVSRTVPLLG